MISTNNLLDYLEESNTKSIAFFIYVKGRGGEDNGFYLGWI